MPVNHEIKSQLAKLLATEDLVVEHKKVETACFNVHTRVLTLPLWERASGTVYDMLVGHEVGHALFTPDEDWTENVKVPPQFVNVVEDARVEKLMKRKYAGLAKTFFGGYKELNEQDFFQLEDEDISTFNLADRANLYFKVGNFVSLDFTAEEKEIINLIAVSETFADVLIAAEELYKYCKKEKEQEKVDDINTQENQGNSTSATENPTENQEGNSEEEGEDNKTSSENQSENEQPVNKTGDNLPTSTGQQEEPEVRTVDKLEDKIRQLANKNGYDNVYVEVPKVNLETIIGKNSDVHKEIDSSFNQQQKSHNLLSQELGNPEVNLFSATDTEFRKFKLSAQKEVNYLVKEFECRKSADAYARASTARTGVLDTARLHTYKFNEDLFKKVSVLPDGKNHGLVFILDWSGSMANVLLDTCKQLFNLVWFCKKVSIPFEVYAFTSEWRRGSYDYETGQRMAVDRTPHYERKESLLCVDDDFALMNLLTSKVSGNELERQMLNIWRLAAYFGNTYHSPYSCPSRLYLSGTPLNESLIALHQILPKFQTENKLQKVQCVILTDGEANQIPYHVEVKRAWDKEPYMGTRGIGSDTFLRDRKLGTTYSIYGKGNHYEYHHFTDTLLKNLRDKFPYTNFIGIRVLSNRDAHRFINLYHSASDKDYKEYIKIQDDWKKLRSFVITKSGYHAYFGLSSSALSQESEFEVADCASKAQIKSAFAKSLKTKKLNKKVLGEFISLVA
jgi:hypothetical protein